MSTLNFARKWRPRSFDEVIGQEVSVRILKNSLYKNNFFPVYLFAGQRGCGKTTSARVFAAAINCEALPTFQQNPSTSIPCLACPSCLAMINGNHADFIEIDAASHTGVDNVRQIIEASSYMPLLGRKKIYLIDEAHMLSKAAFNAFLKILEEPPLSVVFILATTDIPKIPNTVLSRCFQLVFNSVNAQTLKEYLKGKCVQEDVDVEDDAFDVIIDETEGSVRDAINLLERIRLSYSPITQQAVLTVLGKISYHDLITLFSYIAQQQTDKVVSLIDELNFQQRSPFALWEMLVFLCKQIIWIKHGIVKLPPAFATYGDDLKNLAQVCSMGRLNVLCTLLWSHEELFLKTTKKHIFLELLLIKMSQQSNAGDSEKGAGQPKPFSNVSGGGPAYGATPLASTVQAAPSFVSPQTQNFPIQDTNTPFEQLCGVAETVAPQNLQPWDAFIQAVTTASKDLLLSSIFKQARHNADPEKPEKAIITLATNSVFLKTKIEETKQMWQPLFFSHFASFSSVDVMVGNAGTTRMIPPAPPTAPMAPQPTHTNSNQPQASAQKTAQFVRSGQTAYKSTAPRQQPTWVDVKNAQQWPQATLLLRHFPGKIRKNDQT